MDYAMWDDRLDGDPPGRYMTLRVNTQISLPNAVKYGVMRANFNGGKLRTLLILAHGIEERGRGGYGLQFCAEDITQCTVHMLAPLYRKVEKIVLLACSAAKIAKGTDGTDGDGDLLCRRMAKITGAWVRASTYRQTYYVNKNGIDFGDWEGDCWWFGPNGKTKLRADMTTL